MDLTVLEDLKGFVRLDETRWFEATDAVVVVPSRRLKQAFIETVDLRAGRAGGTCWRSSRVVTDEEWLVDQYESVVAAGWAPGRRLLSAEGSRLATAATASTDDSRLLPLFQSGWQLVHDFELTAEVSGFDDHEGARTFRRWALAFRDEAERSGWVTVPELPGLLAALYSRTPGARPAKRCVWLGFEQVPPSWRRLRSAAACTVAEVPLAASLGSAPRITSGADPEEELKLAIDWAKRVLDEARSHCRVGIVVPDLAQRYDEVLYHLTGAFGRGESDGRDALYNLSGGLPLTALQVCADAIDLLRWCFDAESPSTVGRLLASPFLALDRGGAKSRVPALPSRYDLSRFVSTTGHAPAAAVELEVRHWPRSQPLAAWIAEFRRVLQAAGWPGSVTSESFQTAGAFNVLLDEVALAGDIVAPGTAQQALQSIVAGAARRPFAPQRGAAPLQVLGYLESAGLAFSHLWVTGLTANTWPAAPRVHPLIPRRWQAARGVPRLTIRDELDFARRMIHGWSAAAPEVVLSYPRLDEGEATRASALLPVDASHERFARYRSEPTADKRGDLLEPVVDEPVPVAAGEQLVLGAATIRDQSLCPFRAFAVHRLAVKTARGPSTFPPADERGTILHAALDLVYRELRSRQELASLDIERRRSMATGAVDRALSPSLRRRAPPAFIEKERERLVDALLVWFDVDLQRPDFVCEAQEATYETELAGSRVRIRIDRVDRDAATDELIVIDYKSGPVSPNHWRGDRPEDPQLPLYAAVVPGAHEVAFAEVRGAASRMNGVTNNVQRYRVSPAIRMYPPAKFGAGDWDSLVGRWRAIVESLAREHRHGVANVDPVHSGVCRRCHLHTLCRIAERGAANSDGAPDDE